MIRPELFGAEFARECFEYREDGAIVWRERPRHHFTTDRSHTSQNRNFAGKEVPSSPVNGYPVVRMWRFGKLRGIGRHRLVWLIHEGYWADEIDHINGIRGDSRIENLKESTHGANCQRKTALQRPVSGYRGVRLVGGRCRATIKVGQKNIHLGYYDDPAIAAMAYDRAAIKYFGPDAATNKALGYLEGAAMQLLNYT